MSTTVTTALRELLERIFGDPAEAQAYSENPSEYLAAHGVTDYDLSEVDMRPVVMEAGAACGLPEPTMERLDEYAKGSSPAPAAAGGPAPSPVPPPPPVPPADVTPLQAIEEHINYVTYVTYEDNSSIVQNLIDNSSNVSVEVDGKMYGDIDLTNVVTNVNATGDGAVAAGGDIDDSNVNTGSGDINQVGSIDAGDSAVAIGGDATNIQDRSVDNSDNSVDNSTNVDIEDSFNDNSFTDTSVNDNSYTDNSVTDNSVDSSIDVDVALGGGRTGDPSPSMDPGFGTGDPGTPHDSSMNDDPDVRDGTPEQYDEKYETRPSPMDDPMETGPAMQQQPIESIETQVEAVREIPTEVESDPMDLMD